MSAESGHHPIDLLSACIDGEIAPGERRLLESHLETCDRCATLLRDMEALSRVAAAEQAPPVPVGLEARIMARVGSAERSRPARGLLSGWGFRLPIAAAAALAGALALWVAARGFRETTTGPIAPPPVPSPSRTGEDPARDRAPGAGEEGSAGESDDRSKTQEKLEPSRGGEAEPMEAFRKEDKSPVRGEGAEPGAPAAPTGGFAPVPPSAEAGSSADEMARSARAAPRPSIDELRAGGNARKDGGSSAEPGDAGAPAPAAGIMTLAAAPAVLERQLTLREDSRYTITLSESGSLHLEARGYSCALDLIPEEWVEGVPGKGPARESGGGPPPTSWTLAEISALFDALPHAPATGESQKGDQIRSGATAEEGGSQADRSAPGSTTVPRAPSWPRGLSMLDRDGSIRPLAGPGLDEPAPGRRGTLAERLRRLALEMHRSLIEESCGPLPDGLRP